MERLGIAAHQGKLLTKKDIAGAAASSQRSAGSQRGATPTRLADAPNPDNALAHILFDPEAKLESVRVDSYKQLERDTEDVLTNR